jgi:Zn-dependent protease
VKAINGLSDIANIFDFDRVRDILIRVIPALLCITLHELAHGFTAYALGDDTAKKAGRLTLNPIKHLDPMGLLMMVIFGFGYAKPVPVNMMKFRNPKRGMALTAFAGPLSNVVIAAVFLFLYGLFLPGLYGKGAAAEVALDMLATTATLSLAMGIFNLLPIPPLDGSKVLFSLIPDQAYLKLMRLERYGFIVLAVLLYTGVLDTPLYWLLNGGTKLLMPLAQWGFDLGSLIF